MRRLLAALSLVCGAAAAAPGVVVVVGERLPDSAFDVPAAVDAVDGRTLRDGKLRIDLSESLHGVPGLVLRDRHNDAQDLQLSLRGFGARATFGVRGVRLIQDGVPLTMPDGQGQTGSFDLAGAARVEVLRGPFAALYGNASGGVVHLHTEDPPASPAVEAHVGAGAFGTVRRGVKLGGRVGGVGATVNAARSASDGWREHSASRRDTAHAKVVWDATDATRLVVTAHALDQPDTDDPLGLTREQLDTDPRQAPPPALAQDTRKSVHHRQAALRLEHRIGAADAVEGAVYRGTRRVVQYLAIPVAAQGPTSSGGVVDLDRDFGGASLRWRHRSGPLRVTVGADVDDMREVRIGRVNDGGVAGALRRDETDRARNRDVYAIGRWTPSPRWDVAGGVRRTVVTFAVADRYVVGPNPDDSGRATHAATLPVAGVLFRPADDWRVFASIGRGVETPTLAELAYRADGGAGLNLDLRAATSTHAEAGARWQPRAGVTVAATAFASRTRNEIVSAGSSGGRTRYTNADRTRRSGIELSLDAEWRDVTARVAFTDTAARFVRHVDAAGRDLAGRALPGLPRRQASADIAWRAGRLGWSAGVQAQATGRVPVDDANTEAAPGGATIDVQAGWRGRFGAWTVHPALRIANVFDRRGVGSVIVNEGNRRYYEPAPGRHAIATLTAEAAF